MSDSTAGTKANRPTNFIGELLRARKGLPNQEQATRTVAIAAVIPAAVIGLFLSTMFVGLGESFGYLLLVASTMALVASALVLLLVRTVYRWWGFGPIIVLVDTMLAGYASFCLSLLLVWLFESNWLWCGVPLGICLGPLLPRLIPSTETVADTDAPDDPSGSTEGDNESTE